MANSSIETSFQNLVNVIKEKTYPATSGAAVEADIANIKIDITDLGISKIGISQVGMAGGVASLGNDGKVPSSQLPAMTIPVTSVNNKTGDVVLTPSDIDALGISQVGMANGVAGLNSEGKLDFGDLDADIVSKADLEDMWDGEDLPNLPSGYTMLSYIQNTDAQWVNTGVSVTENTSADLIGLIPVEASRYGTFLGEGDQSGRIWSIRYKADSGVIQFQLGDDDKAINGPTLVNGSEYNVHAEIGKLVVNGTEYTGSGQSLGVPIATLRIFDNGSGERARAKLFRCKIYESGVLIRDFIAAKRGTDNAVGMYDVVNNTFYGNDGNGDFTAGSPVGTHTSIGDSSTFKNLIDIVQLNMLPISRVGLAGGVASLDSNGKIPASQLPSTGSDAYRYNIVTKSTGGSDASITIKKYLNEELVSSTDYPYQTFDHKHVIIDSFFDMIYAEDGQAKYTMTLLENSTDHNAGYSKRWGYDETVDFSETFVMSDEDISFIAPPFRADVSYAVGDKVTRNGSFYRCKTPHTGAWDIADFDKISVDELFDEVYDSLDDKANSADLATVATTGSYNDLEDAPNWTSVADTEPKTWGGISAFTGTKIWSDGTDIYYSDGANQYVLDKATSTWSQKTWNGLTNFSGTDLWVDPDGDVYYSYNNTQYKLDKETSTWNPQTWYTIDPGTASYVWNDGENVYYSNNNTQYVLDKATSTWSQKTWSGLTRFYGKYIWTDGTDIYYSNGSTQYVLDKSNSSWVQKTWNGLDNFDGDRVWFDGDDIYYSYASSNKQYVFDKTNNTWVTKTWSNNIDGPNMWNCDDKTYYSNGGGSGTQFEIVHKDLSELVGKAGGLATLGSDGKVPTNQLPASMPASDVYAWAKASTKPTYTASEVGAIATTEKGTANGVASLGNDGKVPLSQLPPISGGSGLSIKDFHGVSLPGLYSVYGYNFWTDGDDIYYSYNNDQYVFNKTTGEWEAKTWTGLTYFDGRMIWTDGTDIYYSGYQDQYVLNKATSTWTAKTWNGFSNLDGRMIWKYDGTIYYSDSANQYVLDVATSTWIEKSAWTSWGLDGRFIWVFNDTVYSSNGSNQFILDVDNDTLTATTWNISYLDGDKIWTDGKRIYYTYDSINCVLDEDNMEWDAILLSINPNGEYIWTDGEHTYYSYSDTYEFVDIPVMTADSEGNITTIGDITDGNGNTLSSIGECVPSGASSSNKFATMNDIPSVPTITAQTTDPGAGSALTTGNLILVYEA